MILLLAAAQALPMYAQRSGRTCGNCHVSPTLEDPEGWDNPALMKRKCTLTCVSCHVDPTGGGLRNTSGRYFSASTLPIIATQDRSYSDTGRELLSPGKVWKLRHSLGAEPKGEGRTVPSDFEQAGDGMGAGQTGTPFVTGRHKRTIEMAFWDGRYGSMNADPIVQFGGDFRAAWYSGTGRVFPMQLDLHAAVHPIHHLTFVGTASGQSTGPQNLKSPIFARRLFVMAHELPGMSWVKVGAFQPAFGTLIDDHTAPVRTLFEGNGAESVNTVIGAEIGTAPNYPFAQASVFANDASIVGADPDEGWGAAVQGGWRDLAWSLTAHAQIRRRRKLGQGDLEAAGIGWGLSPKALWGSVPVTWLGEITVGRRTVSTASTTTLAAMGETSFLLRNGLVAKLRSDVWIEPAGTLELQQRHGFVLSVTPLPGFTLEGTTRVLHTAKGSLRTDALVQTHLSF